MILNEINIKNEPYNQYITLTLHIIYLDHNGGNLLVNNLVSWGADSHSHIHQADMLSSAGLT